jgi:hypothetical protein
MSDTIARLERVKRACSGEPRLMPAYEKLRQASEQASTDLERNIVQANADAFMAGVEAAQSGMPREDNRSVTTLRDGTVGYFSRRPDDCFASALSTCLQIDITDVPDAHIDDRLAAGETPEAINQSMWAEIMEWLKDRSLRMITHAEPPTECLRWIGVIEIPGHFNSHCLVMARDEHIFDPSTVARADGRQVRLFGPERVTLGLSFEEIHPQTTTP